MSLKNAEGQSLGVTLQHSNIVTKVDAGLALQQKVTDRVSQPASQTDTGQRDQSLQRMMTSRCSRRSQARQADRQRHKTSVSRRQQNDHLVTCLPGYRRTWLPDDHPLQALQEGDVVLGMNGDPLVLQVRSR